MLYLAEVRGLIAITRLLSVPHKVFHVAVYLALQVNLPTCLPQLVNAR